MKKHIQEPPYQYMSDLEFFFNASDDRTIFMRVKCPDSSSTYQITVQGHKIGSAIEITENVYEFLPVAEKEAVYFYHHVYNEDTEAISPTYRKRFIF